MTHSLPVTKPMRIEWPFSARFSPLPNSTFVYPTAAGLPALAAQYGVPLSDCRVMSNSLDPLAETSEEVKRLAKYTDLRTPDILIVYPGRLTTGKQFEKAAALAGAVGTASGQSVKIIFCDFPSMDIAPATYKALIRDQGTAYGLEEADIVFTSDYDWPDGFPHQGVMDLFRLSNLFVCTSFSESFGLIVLEAASRGNMLVLNEAVPALRELGTRLNAYFMRWNARNLGYDTTEHYHPSERAYLMEHGAAIAERLTSNPVLHAKTQVRQSYHPRSIWERELKPLLEGI